MNKLIEVEKGLIKILQLTNFNQNDCLIEYPFIINLLVYFLLKKENYSCALKLIKTRKLTENIFSIGFQQQPIPQATS
jgi:hypothetical protein